MQYLSVSCFPLLWAIVYQGHQSEPGVLSGLVKLLDIGEISKYHSILYLMWYKLCRGLSFHGLSAYHTAQGAELEGNPPWMVRSFLYQYRRSLYHYV